MKYARSAWYNGLLHAEEKAKQGSTYMNVRQAAVVTMAYDDDVSPGTADQFVKGVDDYFEHCARTAA